jgi:hypothetical protein
MSQDTCSPATLGRSPRVICQDASPELPAPRCAEAVLMRGEPIAASAVCYQRFLLLEVAGPWGKSALDESHMEAGLARRIAATATANDLHVLLIRRPGRTPSARDRARARRLAWAVADTTSGAERIHWGSWNGSCDDLAGLELAAASLDGLGADAGGAGGLGAGGGQRVVLVCTNGKRDQCCALRGRPVAAAIADATSWDTWECSHLGGHRFAATMLLLPSGDMFGQLDQESALETLRQFDAGQIMLSQYRGRCGQPAPVQAALHAAAVRLGDYRRGAFRVSSWPASQAGTGTGWPVHPGVIEHLRDVEVTHLTDGSDREPVYRVTLAGYRLAPALLSCSDTAPKSEMRYETIAFSRVR